jgi:hypothetical protein
MNFRVKLMVAAVLLTLLTLAACAPPPNLRDNTLLQDTSLVSGDPCAAPCFRGIIPGETAWQDAVTILEDQEDFKGVTIQDDPESEAVSAGWQQGDNQICCYITSLDSETVSAVFLRIAPNMNLGELIEAHGEPTYVAASEFTPDQAVFNLVYPDVPMVVYVFVSGAAEGELSESSEIIGSLYVTSADVELLLQAESLYAWDGYKTYAAYSADEFAVTPSITLTPTATN